jgi:hypothetical protein
MKGVAGAKWWRDGGSSWSQGGPRYEWLLLETTGGGMKSVVRANRWRDRGCGV